MNKITNKQGVILINLGTPDAPTTKAVRRYLRDFLNDPRVIDIPGFLRWILVNLLIVPFRSFSTKKAYQEIWTEEGSPLLVHTKRLQNEVSAKLGSSYIVEFGMRYGKPTINLAVKKLVAAHCETIHILPLFPQYSSAATGSAIAETLRELASSHNVPKIIIHQEFYQNPDYIEALAESITKHRSTTKNHYLFSYHGLPERQITKSDGEKICSRHEECPAPVGKRKFCYRAQCYETTRMVAKKLSLKRNQYTVCFQSRIGKTPWIHPYTEETLKDLATKGIKDLTVICPSFVSDCLETLEEIGIRAKQQWAELGGNSLTLIPCLNEDVKFVNTIHNLIANS